MSNLRATLEAILFVHGEPLASARLAKITGAKRAEVESALAELLAAYRERGITLIQKAGEWQLVSHPDQKSAVEKLVTSELAEEVSRAGLEVLAIIAYQGPISRAAIEYIRGVNSSFTIRGLLIRGLVDRAENPRDRRSFLYAVSMNFLKHLGIGELSELPHYEEFRREDIRPPEGKTAPSGEANP